MNYSAGSVVQRSAKGKECNTFFAVMPKEMRFIKRFRMEFSYSVITL